MIRPVGKTTAFVLAGGRSTRMGSDKAFLEFEGQTLLERMLALGQAVSSDVRIVGSARKFAGFGSVVEDLFPDCGPLGGIHAALRSSSADWNLILAVDMPFLEIRFLEFLMERARAHPSALATIPHSSDYWQPLCAVYRRNFADIAEAALAAGRNKIDPLFARVELCAVSENEITRSGFSRDLFRNLNTPEDLKLGRG
jgi:molybdopterin-guanine dinucleotide biosynthesis protein A